MNPDVFLELAEKLTGKPVKDVLPTDDQFLRVILDDDNRVIDCSQLNELLLLINKDRMERPFFKYFFGDGCKVSDLPARVNRFQQTAMLLCGNFIYAYRSLSRVKKDEELTEKLGELSENPDTLLDTFVARSPKLLEIEPVPKEDTHLLGYLSAGEIIAELERARLLKTCLSLLLAVGSQSWDSLQEEVQSASNPAEHPSLLAIMETFRQRYPNRGLDDFHAHLADVISKLKERKAWLEEVRQQAIRNEDVYLTWDHMDVYFATSMRKRWEYEDLFEFVAELMRQPELHQLNLRYFDPTQSFTSNRVNKGLVEALMLKRAKCTVYSVQDTDTLGKDSELAATLAQGKPVIAYVPEIPIDERAAKLEKENPVTIQERLRFVLYADEKFATSLTPDDYSFVHDFRVLEQYEQGRIWRSVPDEAAIAELLTTYTSEISRLCRIIASSEKRIYDKRAATLTDVHPLALQVNLSTGVANGVLVVRKIPDCAKLLRRVLTNSLEFDLEESDRDQMWYLREKISGSIYRVVTKDRKLTNCFWNFYRGQ